MPTHPRKRSRAALTPTFPDLAGRHVLITGGANGIGKALAAGFVEQGCRVCILDRDEKAGRKLVATLNRAGTRKRGAGEAAMFGVDLAEVEEVERAMEGAIERFGEVDVLVNNAAIDPRYEFSKMTVEEWDRLFAVNVRHYFLTARRVVPGMMKRGEGSIIMTTSLQVWVGHAGLAAYTATKAAIVGMVKSLAREVGVRGVRVNAVAPGWIMTERQLRDHATEEAREKLTGEWQCLPELIGPGDLVGTFLFLASRASWPITRQVIATDGGFAQN